MNLVDKKMHFLGDYHHDFPRLAKQSGFFFQQHRGKVNWSEIENLNLDDITEERNFELLERNLLNVINCNLERDHELKILDQNFVKLFRLAQLGIDYLSYCELYLDRCVVLLQEQLMTVQEELETLKNEDGKNAELKKIKTKKKTNNYQCEKCEKVFISEVYLRHHDKRRHCNPTTPKSDEALKKQTDACQQTENEKSSVSVQTLSDTENNEEIRKIKKGHNKKIKRLERNLNDLRGRLQKAEKALEDAREANPSGFSFPSVYLHPHHLQFVPPCCPTSRGVGETTPEVLPLTNSPVLLDVNVEGKVFENKKSFSSAGEYSAEDDVKNNDAVEIDLVNDKENINPEVVIDVTKPLPPPRKSKKHFQISTQNMVDNQQSKTAPVANISPIHRSISHSPVSVKEPDLENPEEVKENIPEGEERNSDESLTVAKGPSFFKKVVGNSPKLRKLKRNLKRPLTSFYDSVSSTGRDLMKLESKLQSRKNFLVEGLNNQLRSLGIDPEWKGIPKKTMKQKLKHLTHRRQMLSKENPSYTSVRENVEEKILERLKKNFFTRKTFLKKSPSEQETEEEIQPTDEISLHDVEPPQNDAILYDTDTDSEKSPVRLNREKESAVAFDVPRVEILSDSDSEGETVVEKKFDISMFQIRKIPPDKEEEKRGRNVNEADELLSNSDFEDEFLTNSDHFFKPIVVHVDGRKSHETTKP